MAPRLAWLAALALALSSRLPADGGARPAGDGFVFTAAGDLGSSERTGAVLDLARARGDLFVALGDLSYGVPAPERAWCRYVRDHVGADHPVVLVTGNHEARSAGGHGLIDAFVAPDCLPAPLPGVEGAYAKQSYVDHPAAAPLARGLTIAPELDLELGGLQDYAPGSARYAWTAAAIDDARARGIPWVIVLSHRPCLTMGVKRCEMGAGIFNLLVEHRVDLVLHGHDHNYQRSAQLVHGAACPAIVPDAFSPGCVGPRGEDGRYPKGGGTIVVVNGMGGGEPYAVSPGDAEAGYFTSYMTRATYGIVRVAVTRARLDVAFEPAAGGDYRDAMAIVGDEAPR